MKTLSGIIIGITISATVVLATMNIQDIRYNLIMALANGRTVIINTQVHGRVCATPDFAIIASNDILEGKIDTGCWNEPSITFHGSRTDHDL